jgi:hypothetical protein
LSADRQLVRPRVEKIETNHSAHPFVHMGSANFSEHLLERFGASCHLEWMETLRKAQIETTPTGPTPMQACSLCAVGLAVCKESE